MVQQQWQKGARAISITEQKISADGKAFPFAIEPENRDLKKEEMVEWAKRNRDSLALELREQGAILFRGFPIQSAEDFSDFVEALGIESLPYVGGAAVRYRVFKEVHTTNESPPDAKIPFHHEMAQGISLSNHSSTLPGMSLFSMPANHQSDLIYTRVTKSYPEFTRKLEEKGVIYTRVIPKEDDPTSPIGRGWKSTFQSDDIQVVQEKAKGLGVSLIPMENGDIKTVSPVLPAIKTLDKVYNKKVWFNSVIAAATGSEDSRNSGSKAVTYGDGELLDPEHVVGTAKLMEECSVAIPWKQGDVIWIDNNQVLHSRKPGFVAPRKIQAFLGKTNPYVALV